MADELSAARQPVRLPARLQLQRCPLFSERLVIEPLEGNRTQRFYRAVLTSRECLAPWLPWVPQKVTLESCKRYVEACEFDWDRGTALRFALRYRNQPDLIGVVSLESILKAHRSCDLGYWLHPAHQGQGLMTEAAGRVVNYAFAQMHLHRIRCSAAVENLPSRRVAERLQFQEEGKARDAEMVLGRWLDHIVYGRLAHDFKPAADGA